MSQEIELKLSVERGDEQAVVKLLNAVFHGFELTATTLRNIYFDTPKLDLNKHKIALRIRHKGEHYIQTLKTQGQSINGVHVRGEWEWPLQTGELDSAVLKEVDEWPEQINIDALRPVFETNFCRQKAIVQWQGLAIEMAYDCGEVLVEGRARRIHELEFELLPDARQKVTMGEQEKLSILHSLIDRLGNESDESLSLVVDDTSKAERGYELYLSAKS